MPPPPPSNDVQPASIKGEPEERTDHMENGEWRMENGEEFGLVFFALASNRLRINACVEYWPVARCWRRSGAASAQYWAVGIGI